MSHITSETLPSLDSIQQRLIDKLSSLGLTGKTVLEIGCGAGGMHPYFLDRGAIRVVGIDLMPGQIDKARSRASSLWIADRTLYIEGDYLEMASQFEPADIVILDKVIHCTHDPEGLIRQSATRAGSIYAVAFPARRPLLAASIRLFSPIIRLFFPFRVKFTPPERIRSWIIQHGFEPIHQEETEMWHIEIYRNHESPVTA